MLALNDVGGPRARAGGGRCTSPDTVVRIFRDAGSARRARSSPGGRIALLELAAALIAEARQDFAPLSNCRDSRVLAAKRGTFADELAANRAADSADRDIPRRRRRDPAHRAPPGASRAAAGEAGVASSSRRCRRSTEEVERSPCSRCRRSCAFVDHDHGAPAREPRCSSISAADPRRRPRGAVSGTAFTARGNARQRRLQRERYLDYLEEIRATLREQSADLRMPH